MKIASISTGGPVYWMPVGAKVQAFELHPRMGPLLVHKTTEEVLTRDPSRGFWMAYARWMLGGQVLADDGKTCVVGNTCKERGGIDV